MFQIYVKLPVGNHRIPGAKSPPASQPFGSSFFISDSLGEVRWRCGFPNGSFSIFTTWGINMKFFFLIMIDL